MDKKQRKNIEELRALLQSQNADLQQDADRATAHDKFFILRTIRENEKTIQDITALLTEDERTFRP